MNRKQILTMLCAGMLLTGVLSGCGDQAESSTKSTADATSKTEAPKLDGYSLLWNDEFDGTALDESIWNYEPHDPGWTNNELQAYTTSTDNVFLRDGSLVIKALQSKDDAGNVQYTSGKVTTQKKKDFLYGKVVARAKVPEGKGLWPAIWMMPTDESRYGQWPKCGEIDIMEVLGDQVDTAYSTIHYGEPHGEQQGTKVLTSGSFASDFHDYSVEWEPGEIRYYIDDELILTVNDWFTAVEGEDDKPYPAPFDQTFFVQMNLAVGGDWPGNPDASTDFDKAEFEIDYVRVYQKPEYDTNVKKPEMVFRDVLPDGNLIYNGDFAEAENLEDEENWKFLLFNDGKGAAEIKDKTMIITSEAEGTEEYSVQLVQANLPMVKGNKYKITFEACAAAERDMIVCVSAPTAGWIRYFTDTSLKLSTEFKPYTYEFEMTEKSDNNGRLEFNMGSQGSTETIQIRNVRIEQVQ